MAKFALKVVAITFAAIVALVTTVYMVIYAVNPMGLAEFNYSLGNYSIACGFADRAYQADQKAETAAFACKCAAAAKDNSLIIKESEMFVSAPDYAEFTAANREAASNLLNKYVSAVYAAEGGQKATETAFSYLVGYDYHNVVEAVMIAAFENGDGETLSLVLSKLKALDKSLLSSEQSRRLDTDIDIIERHLDSTIKTE